MNLPGSDQAKSTRPLHFLDAWTLLTLSLLLHSGCASPPRVPQALAVPPGHRVFLNAHALGVQIYVSRTASSNEATLRWELKGPEAMLFDDCGKVIGSHYAGPTWESRHDGSKVIGTVLQRASAPGSNAIPWLSLRGLSANPSGSFAPTTFIQRVNTTGGLAPAAAPTAPGEEARVAYTADYIFYHAKP